MDDRRSLAFVGAIAPVLFTAACASGVVVAPVAPHRDDALVGCYARFGGDQPSLRISGANGAYRMETIGKTGPGYRPLSLAAVAAEHWAVLPEDIAARLEAAIIDSTGLMQVLKYRPDAPAEGQPPDTGYVFVAPQVGGPLRPMPCPG